MSAPLSSQGGSLYRRFYLFTLLVCALTLVISFAAITIGRSGEWRETMRRFARVAGTVAAERLAPNIGDSAATAQAVHEIGEQFDVKVTLLGIDGTPITGDAPRLPTPTAEVLAAARKSGFAAPLRHWSVIPLEKNGQLVGYLQIVPAHPPGTQAALRLAATLAAILALVAFLMIPATRSVTRPLERLTESARRFATGDFAHRVPTGGPREIARLGSEMNEMASRLSTVLHTQRQLLADVSHELRSPLARIEVALELARGQGGAPGPLQSIEADVTELTQLVQDILTTSRLDLRPDMVRMRPVLAAELIQDAGNRAIAGGLPKEQLTVDGGKPEIADLSVRADPELLSHALGNLLDNARKHTPEGTKISLGIQRHTGRLLLFVKDSGPGIAPEGFPRLFEPFYRPDGARTRGRGGGAGLGLSLVRRIAELHGEKPFVQSVVGQGSTFGISVPLA